MRKISKADWKYKFDFYAPMFPTWLGTGGSIVIYYLIRFGFKATTAATKAKILNPVVLAFLIALFVFNTITVFLRISDNTRRKLIYVVSLCWIFVSTYLLITGVIIAGLYAFIIAIAMASKYWTGI